MIRLIEKSVCRAAVINPFRMLKYRCHSSQSFHPKSACQTPAPGRATVGKPWARARYPNSMSSHWKNSGSG